MQYHFLPDHETLVAMVEAFRGKLQDSYRKLLATIHEETGHKQSQDILARIEALDRENFSSILTFYYHHTVKAINAGEADISKLLSSLGLALSFAQHNHDQFVVYEKMPIMISGDILSAMGDAITNYEISLRGLPKNKENSARRYLENGTAYLRRGCPKLLSNCQVLVSHIFFVGSDSALNNCAFSLTGVAAQGMVFINGEHNRSWVSCLDKYIHEAAHTYLFLINQEECLVLNDPKELFPSPLREDLRPMEGVYHALFVLITLLYAFSKIMRNNELTEIDREEMIMLMKTYTGGLEKSFTTVMQKGKLTPIGRLLLEEGYNMVYKL